MIAQFSQAISEKYIRQVWRREEVLFSILLHTGHKSVQVDRIRQFCMYLYAFQDRRRVVGAVTELVTVTEWSIEPLQCNCSFTPVHST